MFDGPGPLPRAGAIVIRSAGRRGKKQPAPLSNLRP
jgi:hypothetical protein